MVQWTPVIPVNITITSLDLPTYAELEAKNAALLERMMALESAIAGALDIMPMVLDDVPQWHDARLKLKNTLLSD